MRYFSVAPIAAFAVKTRIKEEEGRRACSGVVRSKLWNFWFRVRASPSAAKTSRQFLPLAPSCVLKGEKATQHPDRNHATSPTKIAFQANRKKSSPTANLNQQKRC